MSWVWVQQRLLVALHDESLAQHGGASGLRGLGLLQSALARPVNLAAYEQPDCADLAAAYAFGLAKNHPFVDGNKPAAFLAMGLFLGLNGWRLTATQAEATVAVFGLAAGELEEAQFAVWLRERMARRA